MSTPELIEATNDYFQLHKETVMKKASEVGDNNFLADAKENIHSYLATIEKLKANSVLSDDFLLHLTENLVDSSYHGKFSVLRLSEQTFEDNSFHYMEPRMSNFFVLSFYEVKFWLEQIANDDLIKLI